MHRYKVIALDVWGHGLDECAQYECKGGDHCDGYTVNDAHYTGHTIEVTAKEHVYNEGKEGEFRSFEADDAEFIRSLVEADMLTPDCTVDAVEVDGEPDGLLSIDRKEDGKYLLQLERVPCTCGFDEKPTYSAHEHHKECESERAKYNSK